MMRKPRYADCIDEHGIFDAECYEEACDRYADEVRDDLLEREMIKDEEESDDSSSK